MTAILGRALPLPDNLLLSSVSPVDQAFQRFLTTVGEKQARAQRRRMSEEELIEQKSKQLIPMRQFLKRLIDLGIVVSHTEQYNARFSRETPAPVSFTVTEGPSSPRWSPGVSLFLEHPAEIEIAIPGAAHLDEDGAVVVRCSTEHPDSGILQGPFANMNEACEALADFLARSTEHVARHI